MRAEKGARTERGREEASECEKGEGRKKRRRRRKRRKGKGRGKEGKVHQRRAEREPRKDCVELHRGDACGQRRLHHLEPGAARE